MRYSDLQRMTSDDYEDRLVNFLYDVLDNPSGDFWFINQSEGHSDIHFGQTEPELFQRLIHEYRSGVSSFNDPATARDYIANAMYFHSRQITDWFMSEQIEFSNPKDFRRLSFTLDMREDGVGCGMNNNLEFCNTRAITVVLDRDFRRDSALGISLVTAYPDIVHEPQCISLIKQEKIEDLVMRKDYCADDIERLNALCRFKYQDVRSGCLNRFGEKNAAVFIDCPDYKYELFVSNSKTRIFKRAPSGAKQISMSELAMDKPKVAKQYAEVLNGWEKIKNKTLSQEFKHFEQATSPGDK